MRRCSRVSPGELGSQIFLSIPQEWGQHAHTNQDRTHRTTSKKEGEEMTLRCSLGRAPFDAKDGRTMQCLARVRGRSPPVPSGDRRADAAVKLPDRLLIRCLEQSVAGREIRRYHGMGGPRRHGSMRLPCTRAELRGADKRCRRSLWVAAMTSASAWYAATIPHGERHLSPSGSIVCLGHEHRHRRLTRWR